MQLHRECKSTQFSTTYLDSATFSWQLHLHVTLETKLYININIALHKTVLLFTLSVHLQHKEKKKTKHNKMVGHHVPAVEHQCI